MSKITLILLFSCLCAGLSAQGDRWVSARISGGFLMAHRPTIPQLVQAHAKAIEGRYEVRSNGEKDWHHRYAGPIQGFAFAYTDMGNRDQLGSMYSLYPYVDFPLTQGDQWMLTMKLGCGLTIVDRTFDQESNFTNQVIGSQGNVGILTALAYRRYVGRFVFGAGLTFAHASNGSYQLPNLGANVPSLDVHIGMRLNKEVRPLDLREVAPRDRRSSVMMTIAGGFRESNVVTREKHPVVELRTDYSKPFSDKMSVLLGADIIYNLASFAEVDPDSVRFVKSMQAGLKAGLSLDVGTAALFLEAGSYLNQGYQNLGGLYHRFGGRKVIKDRYVLSFTLKTHFARADYFAFGVGMKLR